MTTTARETAAPRQRVPAFVSDAVWLARRADGVALVEVEDVARST
jgi:hypothetical protein